MNDKLKRLDIPYTKLKFVLAFPDGARLPEQKVSMLRGSMGEHLLRQHCVRDRDCTNCPFQKTCLIQMTMYTVMEHKPPFMNGQDSIGYLIECENTETVFSPEDELCFYLTLFGRNIEYFSLYLNAFYQMGVHGVGKGGQRFQIIRIENERRHALLSEYDIHMEQLLIRTLNDYCAARMRQLNKSHTDAPYRMTFHTPLSVKYNGAFIREFSAEAVLPAIFRRIQMLDYFTGNYLDMPKPDVYPAVTRQHTSSDSVERYSSTKDQHIKMHGILGYMEFDDLPEELLPYLLAGELLHIGRNTSFGFGRYAIRRVE